MASQSQPLSAPPSPLGSLATVPLEIRQMIYGLVFASSSSLMRTSQAINEEALPILYDHGIRRTRIRYDRTTIFGFSDAYNNPCNGRKTYTSVDWHGWELDEEEMAPLKNISITVDMVIPHHHFMGPRVCNSISSYLFYTLVLSG